MASGVAIATVVRVVAATGSNVCGSPAASRSAVTDAPVTPPVGAITRTG